MSNVTTVASHFGVSAAPDDETIRLAGQGPQRLVLDILSLEGGASPTIKVTATELIESTKEIQILSADGNALDDFCSGPNSKGIAVGQICRGRGAENGERHSLPVLCFHRTQSIFRGRGNPRGGLNWQCYCRDCGGCQSAHAKLYRGRRSSGHHGGIR